MRSKQRSNILGEVFTPPELVNLMLDQLDPTLFTDPTKTYLDPSCGNGNFLVEVVHRKIKAGSTPLQALSTTYGVDIMADNIAEAHSRLLVTASEASHMPIHMDWVRVVVRNVVKADSLKYDFEFEEKVITPEKLERYFRVLTQSNN